MMFSRAEAIQRIIDTPFQVCVIGGGATGSGCALDAALRGLKAVLLEGADFGSGASSASTKLIHGGLRYLQQGFARMDLEQFRLVKTALRERRIMMANAPHLSRTLRICVPCRSSWDLLYYRSGLKMYDWLSGNSRLSGSSFADRRASLAKMGRLRADGLHGTVSYSDGQFDDARYSLALVQSAAQAGVEVLNHAFVIGFEKNQRGKVIAANVFDRLSGRGFKVNAQIFVNATGAVSDQIRQLANPEAEPRLQPSKGVHILLPLPGDFGVEALLIPHTEDGRLIFAIPWMNRLLVGTTDTPCDPADEMTVSGGEAEYLLRHLNRHIDPQFTREEVVSATAGLRPLVRAGKFSQTKQISRDYEIETQSESGLISIMGGKWTVYRAMAEDTVNTVEAQLGGRASPCRTRNFRLCGAEDEPDRLVEQLRKAYPLSLALAEHMVRKYGSFASRVLAPSGRNGDFLSPIADGALPVQAEVFYCIRQEMAASVEDVLARRLGLQFFDWNMSLKAAPVVAAILAQELGWNPATEQDALDEYVALIRKLQEKIGLFEVAEERTAI
jgi:glycerol-3-phosphate dehydrogenase